MCSFSLKSWVESEPCPVMTSQWLKIYLENQGRVFFGLVKPGVRRGPCSKPSTLIQRIPFRSSSQVNVDTVQIPFSHHVHQRWWFWTTPSRTRGETKPKKTRPRLVVNLLWPLKYQNKIIEGSTKNLESILIQYKTIYQTVTHMNYPLQKGPSWDGWSPVA